MNITVLKNNQQTGPYPIEEIRKHLASGLINSSDMAWYEGAPQWVPLSSIPGLVVSSPPHISVQSPPIPILKRYFYADPSNTPIGPFTLDQLQQYFQSGTIAAETQIIEEGGSSWRSYSLLMMERVSASSGGMPIPMPPIATNAKQLSVGMAILWFFLCFPIGFMQWGQTAKGWIWVLISIISGGVGSLAAIVDYWICFTAQQKRILKEWEWFPRN